MLPWLQELATEIILTLGEAFEVAYQVAMKQCPVAPHSPCSQDKEEEEEARPLAVQDTMGSSSSSQC